MTRARTLAVLVAAACLTSLFAAPAQAASPARQMVKSINKVRAAHGIRPLKISRSLSRSSTRYSRRMMRAGYFGHMNRIQASSRFRSLGEVLEYRRGHRPGVRATLNDWLRSPAHRWVILNPGFRYIGAGFTRGRFRGRRATLWAAHLGR